MLELVNISKDYSSVKALDNINFKIEPGNIFGLLGPNGAGKTTTIRIILNIIRPTSGDVLFNGKAINNDFINRTGYLPEERGLYKKSKVIDIIKYLAELKGINTSSSSTLAKKWLTELNIDAHANRKLEELSKGNQQKVQFITAVLHNPDVLILDEPFSGFDPINQELIKNVILSLSKSGKIIILSTHLMDLAEKLCNRIFLINQGKEVCSGEINTIKKEYGMNVIRLEYSGNLDNAQKIPYIKNIIHFTNYAEIELDEEITSNQVLQDLMPGIEIKSFTFLEPTLNKIFIDQIKKSENE